MLLSWPSPSAKHHLHGLSLILITYLALVSLVCSQSSVNYENSEVSIESEPSYSTQRACAQKCLYNSGDYGLEGSRDIVDYLGCLPPWLNGCYCRSDLSSSVTSFLSSCLSTQSCTAAADPSAAIGCYSDYCAGVLSKDGGVGAAIATTTENSGVATQVIITTTTATGPTTSSGTTSFETVTTPTTTITIHSYTTVYPQGISTNQAVSTSSGGGGGGLSASDRIALGVGIGFGLPTLIVGVVQAVRSGYTPGNMLRHMYA